MGLVSGGSKMHLWTVISFRIVMVMAFIEKQPFRPSLSRCTWHGVCVKVKMTSLQVNKSNWWLRAKHITMVIWLVILGKLPQFNTNQFTWILDLSFIKNHLCIMFYMKDFSNSSTSDYIWTPLDIEALTPCQDDVLSTATSLLGCNAVAMCSIK